MLSNFKNNRSSLFSKGFTLIELVIGTTVGTLVIGLSIYFYFSLLKTWNRRSEAVEVYQSMEIALNQIGKELETIIFFNPKSSGVEYPLYIENIPDNLNSSIVTQKLEFYRYTQNREIEHSEYLLKPDLYSLKIPLYELYQKDSMLLIPHVIFWKVVVNQDVQSHLKCYPQWIDLQISALSHAAADKIKALIALGIPFSEQMQFIENNKRTFARRFKVLSAL